MRFFVIALALLALLLMPFQALAAGKVALVIGNGAYQNANKLPNPANDAADMANMLQSLGFTVFSGTDMDHAAMVNRIGEFEEAVQTADTALFFYAGHGMQVDGQNYLIPVNAKLERKSSLQFEAIDSEVVYRAMKAPGRNAIIFLDACRDNPLSRRFANIAGASRSAGADTPGLAAPSTSGGGLFIGFATNPREVAADGNGRNSPFTAALLKFMPQPGLEIQQMMTRVKADVFASTKEVQEPWHNSSLRTEVYLGGEAVVKPEPVIEKPQVTSNVEVEWNAVKNTNSVAVLDAFIAAHGDSAVFTALAEDRKSEIAQKKNAEAVNEQQAGASTKADVQQQAMAKIKKVAPPAEQRSTGWTFDAFFNLGKAGNDGQTVYALSGPPTVDLKAPPKNPGAKNRSMTLQKLSGAASLDALLGETPDTPFAMDRITSCRLDWLDRCPFLPQELVQTLTDAMATKNMDIGSHEGNYYMLSRITNSDDYVLSNAPVFRDGVVAVVAAIVAPDMSIREIYGFDLDKTKLGLEAGAPEAGIEVTGAAVDGDDLYFSFDSTQRCADKPLRYGFIVKFSQTDRSLKWVSPLNVSDANLLFSNGRLLSAYGGSCADDYLYDINVDTGAVNARAKLPSAVERMDEKDGRVTLELYDSAGVYQLP